MLLAAVVGNIEDSPLKQVLQPLFPLLLGLSMICLSRQAMVEGHILGRRRPVWKNKHPILFWISVGIYITCGAVLVAAGLWQWF